jgi:peptide-methionine (R)-S-oxide reductase
MNSNEPINNPLGRDWAGTLSGQAFAVLRQGATEPAFQGEYTDTDSPGNYHCGACDAMLFSSTHKFHSGCGWPSYFQPFSEAAVRLVSDNSFGMNRTEVRCAQCDSHLGHVFYGEGYSTPTDERFCINSISLRFSPSSDSNNA